MNYAVKARAHHANMFSLNLVSPTDFAKTATSAITRGQTTAMKDESHIFGREGGE
jgi:hypothetical protein